MYVHEELIFAAYFLFLFHVHCYLIQLPLCVCHPIPILMILMFMTASQVPINHKQRHHRSLLITNNSITGPYLSQTIASQVPIYHKQQYHSPY